MSEAQEIARLQRLVGELKARVESATTPREADDGNAISAAYYRADAIYQMHGAPTPRPLPGEGPVGYRIRLADGLKKHCPRLRNYSIKDSLHPEALKLVEEAIYGDAETAAKENLTGGIGKLVEVKRMENGKQVSRFYGDSRAAWAPFMPSMQNFIRLRTDKANGVNAPRAA